MKREDEKLLLKDLCARLPYGVKCLVNYTFCNETTDYEDVKASDVDTLITINQELESYFFEKLSQWFDVDEFKPYLLPLSSMTLEQRCKVQSLLPDKCTISFTNSKFEFYGEDYHEIKLEQFEKIFNLFNMWHVDYRGLIPKGLAIDVTELNIY